MSVAAIALGLGAQREEVKRPGNPASSHPGKSETTADELMSMFGQHGIDLTPQKG